MAVGTRLQSTVMMTMTLPDLLQKLLQKACISGWTTKFNQPQKLLWYNKEIT